MAAAATMLAACTQTDFVNEISTETPKAIEFEGGFVNKATRSENSNTGYNETFSDHHSTFAVWAYKKATPTSGSTVVFEGEVVTVNDGNYTYENTAYWDKKAASYAFVAAAPATTDPAATQIWTLDGDHFETTLDLDNEETHPTSATHLSVLKPEKDGAANQDLLISEDVIVNPATHVGAVNLSFIHILSRLNVVLNNTNDKFRIMSVKIKNLPSKGSFDEELAEGDVLQQGTHKRWTLVSDNNKNYEVVFDGAAQKKRGSNVYLMQTLVIPQEITNATTIEVVYGYALGNGHVDVFTRTHTLAEAFGITGDNKLYFNEGWQNTLTLTVETTEITFSASVASWASSSQSTAHVIK